MGLENLGEGVSPLEERQVDDYSFDDENHIPRVDEEGFYSERKFSSNYVSRLNWWMIASWTGIGVSAIYSSYKFLNSS